MSKIALITGGSRGLGRSGAVALAKKGVDIIFTFVNNEDAANEVKQEIEALGQRAVAIRFDARDFAGYPLFVSAVRTALVDTFGKTKIDYLFNNAGVGVNQPFAETSMDTFDELFQLHMKAPYFLTQALLDDLEDNAQILNVSSGLARFSLPGYSAYAAMKGGVEVITRYLAKELGPRGISVNTLAPGAIATDFGGGAVRDNEQINQHVASVTAKGRVGEPQDIGGFIAQILADECAWMTGQRIEVSGGMFL